jgi:hypothetical protein
VNIRSVSVLLAGLLALAAACIDAAEEGRHLFILSGQSNMQRHRPEEALFQPYQTPLESIG